VQLMMCQQICTQSMNARIWHKILTSPGELIQSCVLSAVFAGAMVEVTIAPRNGSASLANCSAAQRSTLAQQKCSIKSGDPAAATACQLMLPCAGEFDLKGCISGSGGNSSSGSGCSKPIRLGRNMTSWVAAPWSTGPGQIRLLADKQNVSLGGDVALTLQNPFWGPTSALVVWGNGVEQEHYHLEEVRLAVAARPPAFAMLTMRCRDSTTTHHLCAGLAAHPETCCSDSQPQRATSHPSQYQLR